MNKTDYQKVCDFNIAFDFPQYDNISDNDKSRRLRISLIEEELTELKDAFKINNYIEEMDACADILYVAYGMAYTYKIDSDKFLENYMEDKNLTLFQNMNNNLKNNIYSEIFKDYNELKFISKRAFLLFVIEKMFYKLVETSFSFDNSWVNYLHEFIIQIYYFQSLSNYNSDKIFDLVHESNMTKLCKIEKEAIDTVTKYDEDFKSGKTPYDTPYYYQLTTGSYSGYYIVKNKSTGKALKSINYIAVNLNLNDYII